MPEPPTKKTKRTEVPLANRMTFPPPRGASPSVSRRQVNARPRTTRATTPHTAGSPIPPPLATPVPRPTSGDDIIRHTAVKRKHVEPAKPVTLAEFQLFAKAGTIFREATIEKTTNPNAVDGTRGYAPSSRGLVSDKEAPWMTVSADMVNQAVRCVRLTSSGSNLPERLPQYMKMIYPKRTDLASPHNLPVLTVKYWPAGDDPKNSKVGLARSRVTTIVQGMAVVGRLSDESTRAFLEACRERDEAGHNREIRRLRFTTNTPLVKIEKTDENRGSQPATEVVGPKDSGYSSTLTPSMLPDAPIANTVEMTTETVCPEASPGTVELQNAASKAGGVDGEEEDMDWDAKVDYTPPPRPKNKGEAVLQKLESVAMTASLAPIFTEYDYNEAVEEVLKAELLKFRSPADREPYKQRRLELRRYDQAHEEALANIATTEEAEQAAKSIPKNEWPPEWHEPIASSPSVTMTE
jgi:hypothetical protein